MFHVEHDLWGGRAEAARRGYIHQDNLAGDRWEDGRGAIGGIVDLRLAIVD
ncbi:MAG: hypothetical protein V1790_01640 [Planctomycetota bacterium]